MNAFNDMAVKLNESHNKLTQSYKAIEEQKYFITPFFLIRKIAFL